MIVFYTRQLTVRKLNSKAPDHCKSLTLFFTNSTLASKYFSFPDLSVFQNKPGLYTNPFTVTLAIVKMK